MVQILDWGRGEAKHKWVQLNCQNTLERKLLAWTTIVAQGVERNRLLVKRLKKYTQQDMEFQKYLFLVWHLNSSLPINSMYIPFFFLFLRNLSLRSINYIHCEQSFLGFCPRERQRSRQAGTWAGNHVEVSAHLFKYIELSLSIWSLETMSYRFICSAAKNHCTRRILPEFQQGRSPSGKNTQCGKESPQ